MFNSELLYFRINRLFLGIVMAVFVYFTPLFQQADKTFPWYFFALAVIIYAIHQVFVYNMFVSLMAFFAQISDPKIGGTYMTLLNTLSNLGKTMHFLSISQENYDSNAYQLFVCFLGGNWVSTTVLYAADHLTWKKCSQGAQQCITTSDEVACTKSGGECRPYIDAYYIETLICTILGIIWLVWKHRTLLRLQCLPMAAWKVRSNRRRKTLLNDNDDDDDDDPTCALSA
jgi:MFS transporter, PAT family, solute carrier family 33 (acetyl-CoA transportor), member 1